MLILYSGLQSNTTSSTLLLRLFQLWSLWDIGWLLCPYHQCCEFTYLFFKISLLSVTVRYSRFILNISYLNPRIDISPRRSNSFYCVLVARPSQQKEQKLVYIPRQIWHWSTEWSRAKANRVLPREHTGHSTLFQQHKRRHYTWTSPDDQYRRQIDYILSSQKWRSSITVSKKKTWSWLWLRSWIPCCQIQALIEESRENH